MAWYNNWLRNKKDYSPGSKKLEIDKHGRFYFYEKLVNGDISCFSDTNPYLLALSIGEIFNPIDIIADRVSSVHYYLSDLEGNKIEKVPKNIERLLSNPNPIQNISQLIYQIQFIQLATGGSMVYPAIPETLTQQNSDYIQNIWVLDPTMVDVKIKRELPRNILFLKEFSELIDQYRLTIGVRNNVTIEPEKVIHSVVTQFDWVNLEPLSPLKAVERNINNLLSVYSARYNAYENNGAAGIISRKVVKDADMDQFEGDIREKMVEEMNKTDGITGRKNFIGISSYPIEFTKTVGTIKELEPFEETKVDQVTIAGIYDIPKFLLPMAEGTTYANQKEAEKSLWQNKIKPYSEDIADLLTKALYLDSEKYKISCNFDGIEALQVDRETSLKSDILQVDLYEKLKLIGVEDEKLIDRWM